MMNAPDPEAYQSCREEPATVSASQEVEGRPVSSEWKTPAHGVEVRPHRYRWILATVAVFSLLLALLSLAINALLIQRLLSTREAGREILDAAIVSLDEAAFGDFNFSYVFSDTIIYTGTVPISQTIRFPFQGSVPFQGNVPFRGMVPVVINVPVIGRQTFQVPVNTNVYVDTNVDVSTTVAIPVIMKFPFEVEMPVRIPVDLTISPDEQPALQDMLANIRATLMEFRARIFD